MRKISFLIAIAFFGLLLTASAQDIAGNWTGKMGYGEVAIEIMAEKNSFTGIIYASFGNSIISNGKIKGKNVTFSVTRNNGKKSEYKGDANGDKFIATTTRGGREVSYEFTRVEKGKGLPIPMTPAMTEFYTPVPPVITPGAYLGAVPPPSDAKVLFDGKDLSKWKGNKGEAKWDVHDGVFTVKKGTGDISTKDVFEDFQLHIEWKIPEDIDYSGQSRGNSGVFMQGLYELQVLDCYVNTTYTNGQAGSIYKQKAPLVNAMRKPGEWNVYDVIYTAPRFKEDGSLFSPARITALHNGVLIQNNLIIRGDTPYTGHPKYTKHGKGPIKLQDHGDPSKPISFRNIWIREL